MSKNYAVSIAKYKVFAGLELADMPAPGSDRRLCASCEFKTDTLNGSIYAGRRAYCTASPSCPVGYVFVDEETYARGKLLGVW